MNYNKGLILWFIIVVILTVIPIDSTPPVREGYLDKIVHFIQFAVLSFLFYKSRELRLVKQEKIIIQLIVVGIPVSLLTESLQLLIPTRHFSIYDIFANYAGVLSIVFYLIIKPNTNVNETRVGEE